MKKILTIVIVCLLGMSITHGSFNDTNGHKYEASINYLAVRGIVQGYPNGDFGPNNALTRAELLKIILGAVHDDQPRSGYNDCFADVTDEWHAGYICYAQDQDIIKGYSDGTFRPDQPVLVAEGLKMALLAFDINVTEGKGSDWYQPFVDRVVDRDVFSIYAIGPHLTMQRGMMAYLIHQLLVQDSGSFTTQSVVSANGCGQRPPSSPPSSIAVGGMDRPLITTVGDNYDEDRPSRLIVAFHGRTNSNADVQSYYKIERVWDEQDIIVYPLGLPIQESSRNWRDGGDPSDEMRDFALFEAIIDEMSQYYCIDPDEIYAIGHSLGGWFSNTLACTHGDVLRGIATVGGSRTKNSCTGPTSALIMHNPADRLASFAGGEAARDQLLAQNGCGPTTMPIGPAEGNCVLYTDCIDTAPVIRCPHSDDIAYNGTYYPHTRPDFAPQLIWDFITNIDTTSTLAQGVRSTIESARTRSSRTSTRQSEDESNETWRNAETDRTNDRKNNNDDKEEEDYQSDRNPYGRGGYRER